MSSKANEIDALIANFHSKKPGSVVRGSELIGIQPGYIPTGIPSLDLYLNGGLLRSQASMISGEYATGKTGTVMQTIGFNHAINADFFAVVVNIQNAWTAQVELMKKYKVDLNRIHLINAETHELGLDQAAAFAKANLVDLIVVDDIASLIGEKETEKSLAASAKMSERAALLERFCRQLMVSLQTYYDPVKKKVMPNRTAVVFINQLRTGMYKGPGGMTFTRREPASAKSVNFFVDTSIILSVEKELTYQFDKGWYDPNDPNDQTGAFIMGGRIGKRIAYEMQKVRSPYEGRTTYADLYTTALKYPSPNAFMGFGFDREESLVTAGKDLGLIQKTGTWYTIDGLKVQGDVQLMERVRQDAKFLTYLYDKMDEMVYKDGVTYNFPPSEDPDETVSEYTDDEAGKPDAGKKARKKPQHASDKAKRGAAKKGGHAGRSGAA